MAPTAARSIPCPVQGCTWLFAHKGLLKQHINIRHSRTAPIELEATA